MKNGRKKDEKDYQIGHICRIFYHISNYQIYKYNIPKERIYNGDSKEK